MVTNGQICLDEKLFRQHGFVSLFLKDSLEINFKSTSPSNTSIIDVNATKGEINFWVFEIK